MPTPPTPPAGPDAPWIGRYVVEVEFYEDLPNSGPGFGQTEIILDLPVPGIDAGLDQDAEDFFQAVLARKLVEFSHRPYYRVFRSYIAHQTASVRTEGDLEETNES